MCDGPPHIQIWITDLALAGPWRRPFWRPPAPPRDRPVAGPRRRPRHGRAPPGGTKDGLARWFDWMVEADSSCILRRDSSCPGYSRAAQISPKHGGTHTLCPDRALDRHFLGLAGGCSFLARASGWYQFSISNQCRQANSALLIRAQAKSRAASRLCPPPTGANYPRSPPRRPWDSERGSPNTGGHDLTERFAAVGHARPAWRSARSSAACGWN